MPNAIVSNSNINIELVPVSALHPAPYNPRKWEPDAIKQLTQSIREFGLIDPIIVNRAQGRENIVIGGHFRLKIAKDLGLNEVPVVYVDIPNETKERELNLRLNKNLGTWDMDILAEFDLDLLKDVGFDSKELDRLIKAVDDEFDVDSAIAEIKKLTSKPGEIYELGRHRLMCGDSTKKENVDKLMDGKMANMVFTDPPYGIKYEGKTADKLTIQNDDSVSAFEQAMPNFAVMPGAAYYVCCPADNNFLAFEQTFHSRCYHAATIVWVKNKLVMGHGDYHFQHEPIMYGWDKMGTHKFYGDRTQTTVWQIDRPVRSAEHPTMKPVELVVRAIKNSSQLDHIVLDLFGGSGTTLIAAEQTGRTCYMMELDPKYCDVIRSRYASLGTKA